MLEHPSEQPVSPLRPRPGLPAWLRDACVIAATLFVIFYLYQPVRVEGTSMNPGLENEDRLFINKFAIRVGAIHHGEVVVFHYPHDPSMSYIKRVIGVPGDTVRIDHGRVFVNGRFVPEPYVPSRFQDDRSQPLLTLGPEEYFVLGDHRNIAADSRDFGPVPRSMIYGKAAFVYWPVDQAGLVH